MPDRTVIELSQKVGKERRTGLFAPLSLCNKVINLVSRRAAGEAPSFPNFGKGLHEGTEWMEKYAVPSRKALRRVR